MGSIALIGTMRAQPGRGDELVAALAPLFAAAADEPGTEVYVLHRAQDDADLFHIYEQYSDADALAAHRASEAMKAAGAQFGPLLVSGDSAIVDVVRANPNKG
jgi:quinol monooxygenase YgiN